MIIYLSFYTIAYLGCPLGFQAFARGLRGYGPQATGSPASIVYRPYALIQRVAPGSCTQSCCSATETDQILTNEQNIPHCPFCCLCSDITNEMVVALWNPRQDPIVHPFLQPDEHCVRDVLRVRDLDVVGSISTGISTSITDPCSCSSGLAV